MAKRLEFYLGTTYIGSTQKVDINEELSNDTLPTFDGNVPDVGSDPSYTVSCDVIRYSGTKEAFINLKKVIRNAKDDPVTAKVVEYVTFGSGEKGKFTQAVEECTLSSNKIAFDAQTRTVANLELKGTKLKEYMDDKEIK